MSLKQLSLSIIDHFLLGIMLSSTFEIPLKHKLISNIDLDRNNISSLNAHFRFLILSLEKRN